MSDQRDNLLKQCDCPSSRWPKCKHPWHYTKRHNGRRYSISLKKFLKRIGDRRTIGSRAEAEKVAELIEAAIIDGTIDAVMAGRAPIAKTETAGTDAGIIETFEQLKAAYDTAVLEPVAETLESIVQERCYYRRYAAVTIPGVGKLGQVKLVELTETVIERAFAIVAKGLAISSRRKYRRAIRRLCKWGARKKHLATNPITDEVNLPVVGRDAMRWRRVPSEEEANLIEAANEGRVTVSSRMAAIIIAAIDTGMRHGELLVLRWADVQWDQGYVLVRAKERGGRKSKRQRKVPLTARLIAVLRYLQISPVTAGQFPSTAYVFGNELGERIKSIKKAWLTIVLRAHNLEPEWTPKGDLTAASKRALKVIDLKFHDLRHEAALRWHEDKVRPLALNQIAKLLGHSDLAQLQVYLGIDADDALAAVAEIHAAVEQVPVTIKGHDGKPLRLDVGQPAVKRQYFGAGAHAKGEQSGEGLTRNSNVH